MELFSKQKTVGEGVKFRLRPCTISSRDCQTLVPDGRTYEWSVTFCGQLCPH
jgi:hypothetical protein